METVNLVSKIGKDGHLKIDVPTNIINSDVEILLIIEKKDSRRKKYDFSDLSGKLQWKGDALKTQKDLRDE